MYRACFFIGEFMARPMGFDFGLNSPNTCFKQKHRWLFTIAGICADGVSSLPPARGARPSLSFKEIEAQHVNETVYFPSKPDWKPINLTLYDIIREGQESHVIFEWLRKMYDVQAGTFALGSTTNLSVANLRGGQAKVAFKVPFAILNLYDGCGNTLEKWTFENVWPQNIEFGELDMTSSDVVTCDLTLRYDRAYYNS